MLPRNFNVSSVLIMNAANSPDQFSFVDAETGELVTVVVSEIAQLVNNDINVGTCTLMMDDGRTFHLLSQADGFRLSLIHPFDH